MPVCVCVKRGHSCQPLHTVTQGTILQSAFHETLPYAPQGFQTGCHTEIERNHRHRHPVAEGVGHHNQEKKRKKGGRGREGVQKRGKKRDDLSPCHGSSVINASVHKQCSLLKCSVKEKEQYFLPRITEAENGVDWKRP